MVTRGEGRTRAAGEPGFVWGGCMSGRCGETGCVGIDAKETNVDPDKDLVFVPVDAKSVELVVATSQKQTGEEQSQRPCPVRNEAGCPPLPYPPPTRDRSCPAFSASLRSYLLTRRACKACRVPAIERTYPSCGPVPNAGRTRTRC